MQSIGGTKCLSASKKWRYGTNKEKAADLIVEAERVVCYLYQLFTLTVATSRGDTFWTC